MKPKIPELKSRNIPVHSVGPILKDEIKWWDEESPFFYPNVLVNLMTCNGEQMTKIKEKNKDLFLLTDSGGFQVVSGTCDLDWKSSALKQIELGASKIFSFDKPTVHKKTFAGSLSSFSYMDDDLAFETIKDNFLVALKQSEFLKTEYPEEFKKFCYILQGKSLEQIKYNLKLFDEYIGGIDNYLKHFPGGIIYGAKGGDDLYIAIAARHAYENFIKKGIYVHFLGMGSPNRMIILIRNEITTFDSSKALQAVRANMFVHPLNLQDTMQLSSDCNELTKHFCTCPVCINEDWKKLIEEKNINRIRNIFIAHNVWHYTALNVFLDAIDKKQYTKIVTENIRINDGIKQALEFCDDCDKLGFDIAYEKYKPFLKKDVTKQKSLF